MSPIPGPIILLAVPLIAAAAAYLVRRWALLAALIAAVSAAAIAALCLSLPLEQSAFVLEQEVAFGRPVVVLGQTLVLDPAGQLWLAFVFGLAAVYYLIAWRTPQGRSYFAFNLVMLAMYALVVLLHTFALSVLAFAMSATLAVFIIQAGQQASVRGAQRYLLVTLLAVPLLLAAAWFLDQSTLQPEILAELSPADALAAAGLADAAFQRALLLAALGFGLLLAAFPFSTWMPALAADAPPIVSAFLFTAGQAMAFFLAFRFVQGAPEVLSSPGLSVVVHLAAVAMAISGGVMAAVQRDLGRMFGYAALSDLGLVLLAFNTGGTRAIDLTLLHLVARSVSITLLAAAIGIVQHRAATGQLAALGGVARRLPVATIALILGALGLAGFPITAGFPTRWAVSRAVWNWVQVLAPSSMQSTNPGIPAPAGVEISGVPGQEWVWIITLLALVLSSVGIIVGLIRALAAMAGTQPRDDIARQPIFATALLLALIAAAVLVGLRPQILVEYVSSAAQALGLF
ncbi:MAG TPA: proton-conducting transporter membrane subunit [Anaerolineae bacterium]|nr:proton-conducting transporter membrane subunit [Anaerolineae bacterium]